MDPLDPPLPADTAGPDADVVSVGALADPLRRALYRYVAAQAAPVNRDQAAKALCIPRHTVKFHLERLVADGLLDIDYARPAGRTGPGAGRPAKLFRRAAREFTVSIPPRHYDLAGRLMAEAMTAAQHDNVPPAEALGRAARRWGRSLGAEVSQRAEASSVDAVTAVLTDSGYEPRVDDSGIVLVNCPFHSLATDYTDLVCGMNLELLDGVIEGIGSSTLQATLDPAPGRCCVRIVDGR